MQAEDSGRQAEFSAAPILVFLIGFVLIFAGVVVLFAASALRGNVDISSGGIVFIGPVPVIFGAGPHAWLIIVLAAVLTVIGFIFFFLMRKTRV